MGLCFKQFNGRSQAGGVNFKVRRGGGKVAWKTVHLAMVTGLVEGPFTPGGARQDEPAIVDVDGC
jgi:hypothetical protein